jgi:glycosyltransferase involved in cell wall biosynthesis
MSRPPLVSVVIPCFNYAGYLGEAIESALHQTYSPIEIIVVDDGSTDDTTAVAVRYPVKLVKQLNLGLAAAGNAGIRASSGEFVMRLDADDRLDADYVQHALEPLLRDPSVHFVYTQMAPFGARSGTYPVEDFDADTLAEHNYAHGSALMRRASFDAVGGYANDWGKLRCEDWDLWLSFAERGLRGMLVPEPLLQYRRHAAGSMVNFNLLSPRQLHRELRLVCRLQDEHPRMFAPADLVRRLATLPGRLVRGKATPRFALQLVAFYSFMLLRALPRRRSFPWRTRPTAWAPHEQPTTTSGGFEHS